MSENLAQESCAASNTIKGSSGNPGAQAFPGRLRMPATDEVAKTVVVCETQPVTAHGIRALLRKSPDIKFQRAVGSLVKAAEILQSAPPSVLLLDTSFGTQVILDWLSSFTSGSHPQFSASMGIVVWGSSISDIEALQLLKAGARGILRKTASPRTLVACLQAVADGGTWIEGFSVRESETGGGYERTSLTTREKQILDLVERGFKNKDIARELGIAVGTVKIHLLHMFRKARVSNRLALGVQSVLSNAAAPKRGAPNPRRSDARKHNA